MENRISDVTKHSVPDFGYEEMMSFGSEEVNERQQQKRDVTKKCWRMLYDSIRRYPKFEKLKNIIEEAHEIKKVQEEEERKKEFEEYLKKQKNARKREKDRLEQLAAHSKVSIKELI